MSKKSPDNSDGARRFHHKLVKGFICTVSSTNQYFGDLQAWKKSQGGKL